MRRLLYCVARAGIAVVVPIRRGLGVVESELVRLRHETRPSDLRIFR